MMDNNETSESRSILDISSFMRGPDENGNQVAHRVLLTSSEEDETNDNLRGDSNSTLITFLIAAESWRFIAYCAFWFMSGFAVLVTKFVTEDVLARGPDEEGLTCGPFNQNYPEKGIYPGEGFDFLSESHLMNHFGYANLCAYWDYSPSRELTAMVYPLFEYSLLMYLILDFFTIAVSHKRGFVSGRFWLMMKIFFPIEIILCSWFRMIFVVLAYENVAGHTAGFLSLQIILILVAIQNTIYVVDTQVAYQFLGGLRNTRIVFVIYLISVLTISTAKIISTIYVVLYGTAMSFTLKETAISGWVAGRLLDLIWMILNAVIPLFLAFIRARSEPPLEINFGMKNPRFVIDGETTPCTAESLKEEEPEIYYDVNTESL